MKLGKNIKDLRIKYGYTQEKLGEKLGVKKQCISNWENSNERPTVENLVKLAEIFSVSTDYLLGRDDKMTLDVTGLSKEIIIIIQKLIDIIRNKK